MIQLAWPVVALVAIAVAALMYGRHVDTSATQRALQADISDARKEMISADIELSKRIQSAEAKLTALTNRLGTSATR